VVEELRRLGHDELAAFEDDRANQAILQERKEILQRGKEYRTPPSFINRERIFRPQFLKEKVWDR
jgi:hypothetical protein